MVVKYKNINPALKGHLPPQTYIVPWCSNLQRQVTERSIYWNILCLHFGGKNDFKFNWTIYIHDMSHFSKPAFLFHKCKNSYSMKFRQLQIISKLLLFKLCKKKRCWILWTFLSKLSVSYSSLLFESLEISESG